MRIIPASRQPSAAARGLTRSAICTMLVRAHIRSCEQRAPTKPEGVMGSPVEFLANKGRASRTRLGLILGTATAALLAMAASQAAADQLKLAFILFDSKEYRQQFDQAAFEAQVAAQGDIAIVQSSQGDATIQKGQVEQLITQQVDAVALWPADPGTACSLVRELQDAGIKVINYNFRIPDCASDYLLQRDNVAVGLATAEAALKAVPKGNYVIVSGDQGTNVAVDDTNGYMQVLQPAIDAGDIKIVSQQWNQNWSSDSALTQVEQALTANNNDVQAILANNDPMGMAALQAVKNQGLAGKVYISGQDADLDYVREMVAGNTSYSNWTIFQDMGTAAAIAARALVTGGELPEGTVQIENGSVTVPGKNIGTFGVTRETLPEWLCTYKFYSVEDVYGKSDVPQSDWP
jgi:D-xylose transport system substrate-binding protein